MVAPIKTQKYNANAKLKNNNVVNQMSYNNVQRVSHSEKDK